MLSKIISNLMGNFKVHVLSADNEDKFYIMGTFIKQIFLHFKYQIRLSFFTNKFYS